MLSHRKPMPESERIKKRFARLGKTYEELFGI